MLMENNIYVSLDEAREEIKKRWNDIELRKRVEEELGDKFIQAYKDKPLAISTRQILHPDNGFLFFFQCAKYLGIEPSGQEFLGDIFVHFNEEKKGLGRPRVILEDGTKVIIDMMDIHANEKIPLKECVLRGGENLVDFYHDLFGKIGYEANIFDNTDWYRSFGRASNYYYYMLLHFVAHGVLFETFSTEEREGSEGDFVNDIVFPNIEKIKHDFGFRPLIVRLYPENQTDEEDFYWWNFPPEVNACIIEYANKNNLKMKKVVL